nr:MAG TPA: hypothetical protein [Bacteriophage sp.]
MQQNNKFFIGIDFHSISRYFILFHSFQNRIESDIINI